MLGTKCQQVSKFFLLRCALGADSLLRQHMHCPLGCMQSAGIMLSSMEISCELVDLQAVASMFVVVFSLPMDHPVAQRESESGKREWSVKPRSGARQKETLIGSTALGCASSNMFL